ncbi:hypothetical protein [Hymenobacter sp. BT491]|uniref:hypothetical protein n=1 Tax=Hymenobacter sp. BT491 TaxID=2766779 RepID=UPI0016535971|nr:hypothetical protein [Hymenobacter sp. BT491]MBC6988975.1 hypothetical protein [Hymenobacter sp. BT491]
MSKPSYSSQIPGSLRRFPKPEKPLLDRVLARVKQEAKSQNEASWRAASVATFGQLSRLRRQILKTNRLPAHD